MTRSFDFAGYTPPRGWVSIRDGAHGLHLQKRGSGRTWIIIGHSDGMFELSYNERLMGGLCYFIMRTDSLYTIFRALGLSKHQAKNEATQLNLFNEAATGKRRDIPTVERKG